MQKNKKNILLFTTLLLCVWTCYLAVATTIFVKQPENVGKEILLESRHTSQQVMNILDWFDQQEHVFVSLAGQMNANSAKVPTAKTTDGLNLQTPLPIKLAEKIENEILNGVYIRFISPNPLNKANSPTPEDNLALKNIAESDKRDNFYYNADENYYNYTRPIFAGETCNQCHKKFSAGELIGAMVVRTDPDLYILNDRTYQYYSLIAGITLGTLIIAILSSIIFFIWCKSKNKDAFSNYSQNVIENMNNEVENILDSVSHVIDNIENSSYDKKNKQLLGALKESNKNIINDCKHLNNCSKQAKNFYFINEEVFNVKDFFEKNLLPYKLQCEFKYVDFILNIAPSVPKMLLGDTFHLRQLLNGLLKHSAYSTKKGSVTIDVSAAFDTVNSNKTDSITNKFVNLTVEIKDTSCGYIAVKNSNSIKSFAMKIYDKKLEARSIINLQPPSEMATLLAGSFHMPYNTSKGAACSFTVQMKLVTDETTKQLQKEIGTRQILNKALNPFFSPDSGNSNASVNNKKLRIIIGDSTIKKLDKEYLSVLKAANISHTHVQNGKEIFKMIEQSNHNYNIIFLRKLNDLCITYVATRIRYIESVFKKPVIIVLVSDNIVDSDYVVLRHFNISTMENFPVDPYITVKVARLAMKTHSNKVFQRGRFYNKTTKPQNMQQLFDVQRALSNAGGDKKLVESLCSMWLRFYPIQHERLSTFAGDKNNDDLHRLLIAMKNSAQKVCLPSLWVESARLEKKVAKGDSVHLQKLTHILEETYAYLEKFVANSGVATYKQKTRKAS